MMNKLIVIEGPDNTGKSSLALDLAKYYRNTKDVVLMHSIKPNTTLKSADAVLNFQKNVFLNQAVKIVKICEETSGDNVIIMDRAWYGEYVYGQIYRHENPNKIVEMLNIIDDYLSSFKLVRSTILTNATPQFILNNDDHKSFFSNIDANKKMKAIEREISLFNECFEKTLLKTKESKQTFMKLDVEQDMNFVKHKTLLKNAIKFIERI